MDIQTEEKYTEIIYRLLEFYSLFENAFDNGDVADEVMNFCYPTLMELKDDIQRVSLPKKGISS